MALELVRPMAGDAVNVQRQATGWRRGLMLAAFAAALFGLSAAHYSPQAAADRQASAGAPLADTLNTGSKATVRTPSAKAKVLAQKSSDGHAPQHAADTTAASTWRTAERGAFIGRIATDARPERRSVAAQPRAPPTSRA